MRLNAPMLSLVLSFRNEEQVLPFFTNRLENVLQRLELSYELIFVNDASSDASLDFLQKKAESDPRIKVLNMSRRFGVPACLVAGMRHASGDAVITMDTDLQDPPEVIPQLIQKWQEGAEIVYTVRNSRAGETLWKQIFTRFAYQVIRFMSQEVDLPVESGDFRLLSRRACQELSKIEDHDPYLRGLVRALGFSQVPVYYDREKRYSGESHFPIFSKGPIRTFLSGVLSFSTLPLQISFILSAVLSVIFLISLFVFIFLKVSGKAVPGGVWILGLFSLFGVCQFFALGVIGLYVGRMHQQSQKHPLYVIASTLNFQDVDSPKVKTYASGAE